ncbi:hypothetical protein ABPG75_013914 [Micractinium tetrahymenae]
MKAGLCFLLVCLLAGSAAAARELHATNPCAGKKDGTILPSAGCSPTYYQCWRGKPVSPNPKCAAGTVFNPKATPAGCSYVGAVGTTGCNCAAAFKGEQAVACTICQKNQTAGIFPLYNKPWPRYVECSTQGAFVMPCNTGLKFNPKTKNCQ